MRSAVLKQVAVIVIIVIVIATLRSNKIQNWFFGEHVIAANQRKRKHRNKKVDN